MNSARVFYHLARADFLERVRRYGFLLVLTGTLYLGFAINRGDIFLKLGEYRGVLNSAWVGGMFTSTAVVILSLFGFYVVKNVIERDRQTRVGQIIATSPVTSIAYLIGKWLSNWLVLASLIGILAVAAVVMQLMGGESAHVDVVVLLLPFCVLALPAMALVAALALFFETVPLLRGGFGNVLYFFVWSFALSLLVMTSNVWMDWSGMLVVYQSMGDTLRAADPAYTEGFNLTMAGAEPGALKTFLWSGVEWTSTILLSRLVWLAGSVGLVCFGGVFFHRFDPALEREGRRREKQRDKPRRDRGFIRRLVRAGGDSQRETGIEGEAAHARAASFAGRPAQVLRESSHGFWRSAFVRVVIAEIHLMLRGQSWWWYAAVVGLIIAGLVSAPEAARRYVLLIAWLWPVLIWSALGTREGRFGTFQMVFSSPHPISRQLLASWIGGIVVAVICGSGVGLNLLFRGEWPALWAWCAGALFVPSLALALGTWSQTNRLFEIVYVVLWYVGPLHPLDIPGLDFMGAADASIAAGVPLHFVLAAGVALVFAVVGRWVRMRV